MAKTFEEQTHSAATSMANMVYQKYMESAYMIKTCKKCYSKEDMQYYKLKHDYASYGVTCDKLATDIPTFPKKLNCTPKCAPLDTSLMQTVGGGNTDPDLDSAEFTQSTPSATWVFNHGLSWNPEVTVVTQIGGVWVKVSGVVSYPVDKTTVQVDFSKPITGKLYAS